MLILMGGPQSPLNMGDVPYLKDEIGLIQETHNDNKPVLGFCLGAQLIGEAFGAQNGAQPA